MDADSEAEEIMLNTAILLYPFGLICKAEAWLGVSDKQEDMSSESYLVIEVVCKQHEDLRGTDLDLPIQ